MVIRHRARWVWVGRVVFALILTGLVVYLVVVGLDKADKVASSVSCVVALIALVGPHLMQRSQAEAATSAVGSTSAEASTGNNVVVNRSGDAKATNGGDANTGAETADDDTGAVHVSKSGAAVADGPGSVANSGVRRIPKS